MTPRYHEAIVLAAFIAAAILLLWAFHSLAKLANEIHETHQIVMRLEGGKK